MVRALYGTMFAVALLAGSLLEAQNDPLRVCVSSAVSESPPGSAHRLADILSREKLRSGRGINALVLSAKSFNDISSEVQTTGCEYLIRLAPWETLQGGMDIPNGLSLGNGGSGAPMNGAQGATPPTYPTLDWPSLNYELTKVGQKHFLAKGAQFYQRVHAGNYSAFTYKVNYSVLAAKLVRTIPG